MNCVNCKKPASFVCNQCKPSKFLCSKDKISHVRLTGHTLVIVERKKEEEKKSLGKRPKQQIKGSSIPPKSNVKSNNQDEEVKIVVKKQQETGNLIQDSLNFNSYSAKQQENCIKNTFPGWRQHGIFSKALLSNDCRFVFICIQ